VVLVVLRDSYPVELAELLGIYQEEEACIQSGVGQDAGAIPDRDLPVIVHVGHAPSHCEVAGQEAVGHDHLARVLYVKHAALVSVVTDEGAVREIGVDRLIVREEYRAAPD
jgi:hypothetical protein